ncbi:dihydrofolate reductase family protein [Desulfoluna spongiiphila]|uniref:Dihydrofolate reductase n=1 Tax=Desulfoluna spongiiphila TaxID=419481 RepID=A0A1G5CYW8_9BACT|nr:dihydrofolate reductase family protein [Desulfoluna spongiiphila]SCY07451.1 Dihydrofolate reductase [Desulfoluna spongiiphila]
MSTIVYLGISLDGYIADRDGGLDWLQSVPNPDNLDFGWADFMDRIDAIVMGRKTFEAVCGFECDWPYSKPVYVLSHSLPSLPHGFEGKAELIGGSPSEIVEALHRTGHRTLYIDGGKTVQEFLKDDLIDEMVLTTVPVLLGGGTPLFGDLPMAMAFKHVRTDVHLEAMVQTHYRRKR